MTKASDISLALTTHWKKEAKWSAIRRNTFALWISSLVGRKSDGSKPSHFLKDRQNENPYLKNAKNRYPKK